MSSSSAFCIAHPEVSTSMTTKTKNVIYVLPRPTPSYPWRTINRFPMTGDKDHMPDNSEGYSVDKHAERFGAVTLLKAKASF